MKAQFYSPAAVAFFLSNAGYSYDPRKETPRQGRRRTAEALARAEADAREAGISFGWEVDQDATSADWSDERPEYRQWLCIARGPDGMLLASLGGIDLGADGSPVNTRKDVRVYEAELASEALAALAE